MTTDPTTDDGGINAARVPKGGRRDRLRSHPATRHPYRLVVLVVGVSFIALGIALAVLPGPLTIPPVLLGLWILSWEFRFAQKFFEAFKDKGDDVWEHAKAHPVSSALITVVGLIGAAVAMWATFHYDLVAKAKDAIGL